MNPVDILKFLQRDVIGQHEVLRYVSVAIFKHLRGERYGNLMMIGNSGTGKTTIMRSMERLYQEHDEFQEYRVVVIMNANMFATDDGVIDTHRLFTRVEERARQILGDGATAEQIGRHMERATVCLDEIDKVSGVVGGRPYVTGLNIQQALLTLIEGERVLYPLTVYKNNVPERVSVTVDSGKMLFLCAGAFETLYDQVFKRVTSPTSRVKLPTETILIDGEVQIREFFALRHHFKQEDLFDYGMQPQFLSRFDNAVILEELDPSMLRRIFVETENGVFQTSKRFFEKYEIELDITEGAIERIAAKAAEARRIGARALKEVYGRIIKPFEFDPFSRDEVQQQGDRRRLVIDEALVMRALKPPA
ncbi:MAG TPA: AAA family ATPase [Candidatus Polarisedimenticolaceae bacterium]|nr:AAA family ATPase [Candidatus Polarisedimenticolaceae bacterium]